MPDGLVAATLHINGHVVGMAGAIIEEEATALAAFIMQRLQA